MHRRASPKCGEVDGRKEVPEGKLGLLRNVHLSFVQPLNEILWCQIDDFDVVGPGKGQIGHRSRTRTWVIWATTSLHSMCWMLTVVCDVDAPLEQFFDV